MTTDGTTDMATSHLTNPAKDAGQVIGYSHSAMPPKNGGQAAGYSHPTKQPKDGCQVVGYIEAFAKQFIGS